MITVMKEELGFGILPISTIMLERLLCLPDGYTIIGMNFDAYKRTLDVALMSNDLPHVEEGCEFPRLSLHVTQEVWPGAPPEYRKITVEVKVP